MKEKQKIKRILLEINNNSPLLIRKKKMMKIRNKKMINKRFNKMM